MAKLFEMRAPASARLAELGVDETAASITGRYSLGQTLGEGRFSQVVAATCVRTGADVALKAMALAEVTDDKEAREMLAQEVAVLRRANGCQVPDARHTHAARPPRSPATRRPARAWSACVLFSPVSPLHLPARASSACVR